MNHLEIDGILVDESFTNHLKRKIADVLATRDVRVTKIQRVDPSIEDSVRLECDVSFDDKSIVHIEMPKSEFDAFLHLHPDKIVLEVEGMCLSVEMWQVIREKLVYHLDRSFHVDEARACDKIYVVDIKKEDCIGDIVILQFQVCFDYPNDEDEMLIIFDMPVHKSEFEKCRTKDSRLTLADWYLSFDDKSVVHIDRPKFVDKVVFDGMHMTEEMWRVIRQKLVVRLERIEGALEHVQKCDKIRLASMNIEYDYGPIKVADLISLVFEGKYEYPDKEEPMTIFYMFLHKSEFEKCRTEESILLLAGWFKEIDGEEKEREEEE